MHNNPATTTLTNISLATFRKPFIVRWKSFKYLPSRINNSPAPGFRDGTATNIRILHKILSKQQRNAFIKQFYSAFLSIRGKKKDFRSVMFAISIEVPLQLLLWYLEQSSQLFWSRLLKV